MSTLSSSSKRNKLLRHLGVGDILTSNSWLLISISLFLSLEINVEVTDVRALLLLSKETLPLIGELIYKMRVSSSLRNPVFKWWSEALVWDILSAVSSDYFVLSGSFALYFCMKSLDMEPTW